MASSDPDNKLLSVILTRFWPIFSDFCFLVIEVSTGRELVSGLTSLIGLRIGFFVPPEAGFLVFFL